MLTLIEIISILFIHWIADFVMQSDKDAQGKSKKIKRLLSHTLQYSMYVYMGILILYMNTIDVDFIYTFNFVWFFLITFITHTIIDYFTSKLNTKLWKENKIHNFFVSIGFDQFLHYVQLFVTYYILFK